MPALPPDAPWRTLIDVFGAVADRGARAALTAPSADGEMTTLGGEVLVELVARTARALTEHDVGPGTTVGIHLDNTTGLEALVLHWAAQWLGAAPVPLGTRLTRPELEHIVGHARPALICSARGHVELALAVGATTAVPVLDITGGVHALTIGCTPLAPAAVDEHDVADVLYTSGTTGRPKGVELTHANDVAVALEFQHAMDLTEEDVFQSAIPYFTSTGVHTNPLPCLASGAHLVMEPSYDQHRVLSVAEAYGTTTYLAAPSMMYLLLRDVDVRRPTTLRHLLFGGSVMNARTLERLAAAFPDCALTNLYGQTEAGPGGTVCKPADILAKAGSIGNQGMGPWTEFGVQRGDGSPAATGELGEIVLRGPTIMRGYRDDPEQTASTLAGGWLHTGDLGTIDDDGFLFYADRLKDLVIRGGLNIATAEVESALLTHPSVEDVAVIGVEHEVLGEDVLAFVVASEPIAVDALLAHARTLLADYKTPRRVVFVDELPRNGMGKVLKRELRASV